MGQSSGSRRGKLMNFATRSEKGLNIPWGQGLALIPAQFTIFHSTRMGPSVLEWELHGVVGS